MMVTEAGCGRDAIAACISTPPHVLLLDLRMPDMDGFRVLETIRGIPGLTALPVIMMTSAHQATKVRKAVESGASDFIAKPFPWPLLIERVEHRASAWLPCPGIPVTWTNGRTGVLWIVGPVPILDKDASERIAAVVRVLQPLRDEQIQVNLAGTRLTTTGFDRLMDACGPAGGWTIAGAEGACGEPDALRHLEEHVPRGGEGKLSLKSYLHGRIGVIEARGSCLGREALLVDKIRSLAVTRTLLLLDCTYAVFPRRFLDSLTDLTKELWSRNIGLNFVVADDGLRRDLTGRLGDWALVYSELSEALEDLQ